MNTELVKVNFHGDVLEAAEKDGHIWASIRRMCENLGLGTDAQIKRIKRQRWGVTSIMDGTGPDGKRYEVTALRADKIPIWIATLDQARIKDKATQEKVAVYQDEATDVLANHFLKRGPAVTAADMVSVATAVAGLTRAFERLVAVVEHQQAQIHALAGGRQAEDRPLWKLEHLLADCGWPNASTRQRANIRDRANCDIRLITGQPVELLNGHSVYTRTQIPHVERAIRIERLKVRLAEEERGLGIFEGCVDEAA